MNDDELTTEERACLLSLMPPNHRRALTLERPQNSLSESCRQLLATPYDAALHPYLKDMLASFERQEGASDYMPA